MHIIWNNKQYIGYIIIASRYFGKYLKKKLRKGIEFMRTLIIYCSDYKNNTQKVASKFNEEIDCDLINVKDAIDINLENYDLIGFGSGVYMENLSPKLFKLIERLNLTRKNVFVFSTSGIGMKFYNNKLIKALTSKGAINKGSFACKGSFIAKEFSNSKVFDIMGKLEEGHPNDKDFKKAEVFIRKIIDIF